MLAIFAVDVLLTYLKLVITAEMDTRKDELATRRSASWLYVHWYNVVIKVDKRWRAHDSEFEN